MAGGNGRAVVVAGVVLVVVVGAGVGVVVHRVLLLSSMLG